MQSGICSEVEERAVRFIQLWFIRGGHPKSFAIPRSRERSRGDDLDGPRSTVSAVCRRATLLASPTRRLSDPAFRIGRKAMFTLLPVSRHHQPRRLPFEGCPSSAQADARSCPQPRSRFTAPRSSTSTFPRATGSGLQALDSGSTRADVAT